MNVALSDKVIFKERQKPNGELIGDIQLNCPLSLNALDLDMVRAIENQLKKWREYSLIKAIFLHGKGEKSFCAGGDVKKIYSIIISKKLSHRDIQPFVQPFFETEYRLDYLLHTYPKPVVVWGNGWVMGGGMGLFLGGSHSIVTENTYLSMPEIMIGFFTDVGSSYFLSRMPYSIGWYIALTAYRINFVEILWLMSFFKNKKTFYFQNLHKESVIQTLVNASFSNKKELTQILLDLQNKETKKSSYLHKNWLKENKDFISKLFLSQELKAIYRVINTATSTDSVFQENKQNFLKGSPSSLGVICELLKRAREQTLEEVFQTDLTLALNVAHQPDFIEGVRAVLVDKTNQPKWNPSSISAITSEAVQKYFNKRNKR